jgi:tetratricopeptide (TPR) repeat protein
MRKSQAASFGVLGPLVATLMVATSAPVGAQDSGLLRTTIGMPDTDEFFAANMTGHRSYVELDALVFTILTTNQSTAPLVVDQVKLREAYTALVRGQEAIPVRVRWSDEIQTYDSNDPVPTSELEQILIEPRNFVRWTLMLERVDGQPFTWGEYVVFLNVGNLRPAVKTLDGGTWGGRLPTAGIYERIVSVKAPRSPAETARLHGIAAGRAFERGDYEAQLQSMLLAAAADPSLTDNLALVYLATGRYKEAISGFERIAARRGLTDPAVHRLLAQAYLGVGDEANARRVLSMAGLPSSAQTAELESARQRVRERAKELGR